MSICYHAIKKNFPFQFHHWHLHKGPQLLCVYTAHAVFALTTPNDHTRRPAVVPTLCRFAAIKASHKDADCFCEMFHHSDESFST